MSQNQTIHALHRNIHRYYETKGLLQPDHIDLSNVVTVTAAVAPETVHCLADHKGAMHQHFYIDIKEVLEGDESLIDNNTVFVSVRYGDEEGIDVPVPDLVPGRPIVIRGKYIPSFEIYETEDNPGYPVLHFTHRPVGYIDYNGKRYE